MWKKKRIEEKKGKFTFVSRNCHQIGHPSCFRKWLMALTGYKQSGGFTPRLIYKNQGESRMEHGQAAGALMVLF